MSGLISLEEAQQRLLALASQTETRSLDLSQVGAHHYLARDVTAQRSQPAADLSAMDGYAVRGPGPWEKIGESRAGAPFAGTLSPGQCARISTGAHMPAGAESVLIQENAVIEGSVVALAPGEKAPPTGRHVRKAGFDFGAGDTVLRAGTRLSPAAVAVAIAAGQSSVPVVSPPSIAVMDSGDELVPIGQLVAPHQIPASNGIMLSWMLAPYVGSVNQLGPVPDDPAALAQALDKARDCHILITSGGASVGDHDLIQPALRQWDANVAFWKVAIRPGKPLMVATKEHDWGRQVILGLPGNPVSSFVTAFLFALPLVRAAMGDASPLPTHEWRVAAEDLPAVGRRQEFVRGISKGEEVRRAGSQDSSALASLARADCLIDRPAGAPEVRAGERVPVYNLRNG